MGSTKTGQTRFNFIVLRRANCSKYTTFIKEPVGGDGMVFVSNFEAHYAKA
jgi:hypothetical protein